MQYRPNAIELLSTIQDFLMKEIMPVLSSHEDLSYKTLVSWNMLGIIAREMENSSFLEQVEKEKANHTILAEKIRKESISSPGTPEWNQTKKALRENLKVANPRFALDE